jgi:hypothetical protein
MPREFSSKMARQILNAHAEFKIPGAMKKYPAISCRTINARLMFYLLLRPFA